MIWSGLCAVALGWTLKTFDWPRVYGGVPYTLPRHHLYEWIVFVGWVLIAVGHI